MQRMASLNSIKIKEKASLIEAASAILGQEVEMANRYRVLDGSSGRSIFYAVEQTSFVNRNLKQCCADCAGWEVDVLYTENGAREEAFHLERPWTFNICCNRPEVHVFQAKTGSKVGSIIDPCTCCCCLCDRIRFDAKDADGYHVATADAGWCQWGLCCPCPCGPCSRITLDITDADGDYVGHVQRQIPGPCTWFFVPDVDHYHIDFKDMHEPSHKVLMMALALFMDFRYFNDNSWDQDDDPSNDATENIEKAWSRGSSLVKNVAGSDSRQAERGS